MDFDVIVVGGGPTGLAAAWKCANLGLSTLVIEKKKHICENKRANTCMLHIAPGLYGENVSLRRTPGESRIVFQENGFSLRYTGDQFDYYNSYLCSPSGRRIHMRGENRPLGTVFDMDVILSDLLREASERGASFLTSALVIDGENKGDKARVKVKKGGKTFYLEAKKVLVAEGLVSRAVESLGLNENRRFLIRIPFLQYTLEGVEFPLEPGIVSVWHSPWIFMAPDATGKNRWAVISAPSASTGMDCKATMEHFLKKSVYSSWFKKAYPVTKLATTVQGFTPLAEPCQGHFLILGESTSFGETQVHGGMMCGWWAGDAVYDELSGKEGYKNYQEKWLTSFPCSEKKQMEIMKVVLVHAWFTAEETDYLFSLLDGKTLISGPGNPYEAIGRIMGLFATQPGIKKEMAEKAEKLKNLPPREVQQLLRQWGKSE